MEQRPQPASRAAARGPGQRPRLKARLQLGAGTLPSALPKSEPERQRAGGQGWPGPGCRRWPPRLCPRAAWPALSGPLTTQGESWAPHAQPHQEAQGPGRQPGPLRGPRCPGRWAFGRQTLHRGPTAAAQPSPPSRPRCGHLSEGAAPASPTPKLSPWLEPSLRPIPHLLDPKSSSAGIAKGRQLLPLTELPCHPQSCPGDPRPGFSCLQAGQHHAASAGTCTRGPGGGGPVWAGPGQEQPPVLPCCPTGRASASGGQCGNRTQELDQQHPLRAQSRFLQLPEVGSAQPSRTRRGARGRTGTAVS